MRPKGRGTGGVAAEAGAKRDDAAQQMETVVPRKKAETIFAAEEASHPDHNQNGTAQAQVKLEPALHSPDLL